jgi:hypothetical protein
MELVPLVVALLVAGPIAASAAPVHADLKPVEWSWLPVPDAHCDDGTPTGLGVSPGTSADVIVYLDGGGACWTAEMCLEERTSRRGPWGERELRERIPRFGGTLLDRSEPRNPFRTWTYVFVPYCTGDVHSGDRATTYVTSSGERGTLQHRGRANVLAFAEPLGRLFPNVRRLVIAGSSAGGYGTLVNYDVLRRRWPAAKGYLVDDAGPALRGLPAAPIRDAWWAAWGTPQAIETFCPGCARDISLVWRALSRRWPGDRIAFLSSLRDDTMRWYLCVDADGFERALRATVGEVLEALPNVRTFLAGGESHTMLNAPARFGGSELWRWLTQMVEDDPGWSSRRPRDHEVSEAPGKPKKAEKAAKPNPACVTPPHPAHSAGE